MFLNTVDNPGSFLKNDHHRSLKTKKKKLSSYKRKKKAQEKVVHDIIFSEYIVCLDISHSLGCLAENCDDFLFRDSLSFH